MTGSGRIWIPYFISFSSSKFKKAGTQRGHINKKTYDLFSHRTEEAAMIDSLLIPTFVWQQQNTERLTWWQGIGPREKRRSVIGYCFVSFNGVPDLRCVSLPHRHRVNERRFCLCSIKKKTPLLNSAHVSCQRLSCHKINSHTGTETWRPLAWWMRRVTSQFGQITIMRIIFLISNTTPLFSSISKVHILQA